MGQLTDGIENYLESVIAGRVAPVREELMASRALVAELQARVAELEKPPAPVEAAWKLRWSDAFNTINPETWTVDGASTYGSGNGHEQINTNRSKNVRIQDGALVVEAHRENPPIRPSGTDPLLAKYPNGRPYSAGHLKSKRTFRFGATPMKFEVRAKLPLGPGLLPCPLWFRPVGSPDGEIDVVEATTQDAFSIVQTVHQQYSPSKKAGKTTKLATPMTEWHTYGVEIWPDRIEFEIDGMLTARVGVADLPRYKELFGTDRDWLMHITLGVGGSWVGAPEAWTPFPAAMTVGWIRAYTLD